MKKKLIIFFVLVPLVYAFFLFRNFKINQLPDLKVEQAHLLKTSGVPVLWKDNNELYVISMASNIARREINLDSGYWAEDVNTAENIIKNESLKSIDINKDVVIKEISNIIALNSNFAYCFSNSGSIFNNIKQKSSRWVRAEDVQMSNFSDLKDQDLVYWKINPIDCSLFDYSLHQKKGRNIIQNIGTHNDKVLGFNTNGMYARGKHRDTETYSTLFLSRDAIASYILSITTSSSAETKTMVIKEKKEGLYPIVLDEYVPDIKSSYDVLSGNYLWYDTNFAWEITPDMKIIKKTKIPWIKYKNKVSMLDSCGSSCYITRKTFFYNGDIYVYISGKFISEKESGLYLLRKQAAEFKHIVAGSVDLDEIVFSPNGCKIAYSKEQVIHIMDVCNIK